MNNLGQGDIILAFLMCVGLMCVILMSSISGNLDSLKMGTKITTTTTTTLPVQGRLMAWLPEPITLGLWIITAIIVALVLRGPG